jgi:hypothetical protein
MKVLIVDPSLRTRNGAIPLYCMRLFFICEDF